MIKPTKEMSTWVFKEAGVFELQTACKKLAPIQTGDAVITPGFGLPAKFVIHTAGPVYHGGSDEEEQLRSCYLHWGCRYLSRMRLHAGGLEQRDTEGLINTEGVENNAGGNHISRYIANDYFDNLSIS